MSHEICTAIFRRLGQLDLLFSKDTPGMIWRKYLEPDFSASHLNFTSQHKIRSTTFFDVMHALMRKLCNVQTTVLSNGDPLTVHSIRTTFQDGTVSCNPASSQMWFVPAILPDGWAVYAFDMTRKRIIVLDPAVGPFDYSNRRVKHA